MDLNFDRKTGLAHITIWFSYLILILWFYDAFQPFHVPFIRCISIVLIQAGIFYLNYFILLPRFFETKKYFQYFLLILLVLVVSLVVIMIIDYQNLLYEINRDINNENFSKFPRHFKERFKREGGLPLYTQFFSKMMWRQVFFNGFFIVIVLFISTIYRNLLVNQQKEKESLLLLSQVKDAESKMLKSQINPHFLFNTLNNIYSMAQLKSDHTADAVHRLSDMLRYVIYECNENLVKLGQEVNYIESYIKLQLLKDDKMQNVNYSMNKVNTNLKIAPMLLIPFIENSFKHSHIEDTENSWIVIELSTQEKQLHLKVLNSLPQSGIRKDKTGGVGRENVEKRLNLLYPDKHFLKIEKNSLEHKVELMIELNES